MDYKNYDIVVKGKKSVKVEPLTPGYYPAVCYGVVVTGTHFDTFNNGSRTECIILWELPTETFVNTDGEEIRKTLSERYTFSLTKSNLQKTLESWRGKPFTDEELDGFSLNKIIGANCGLTVINKISKSTGEPYPKIQAVTPLDKRLFAVQDMAHEPLWFNICDNRFDLDLIDELPNWIAEAVRSSDEYNAKAYANGKVEDAFSDEPIEEDGDLPF
jgi:hypothetical protein